MPFVDAVLAFALTMLVVASVAAMIVRAIKTTAKLRSEHLKEFLLEYYGSELQPVVQAELDRLGQQVDEAVRQRLLSATKGLTAAISGSPQAQAGGAVKAATEVEKNAMSIASTDKILELSTKDMIERLKQTELGRAIVSGLKDHAETVFQRLGERYEEFGERFSASFRKSARIWATGVAFVLAFVLNVDCVHLADEYLNSSEARGEVLGQQQALLDRYESLISAAEGEQEPDLDALRQQVGEINTEIRSLQAGGLPVGWKLFPWCVNGSGDTRCQADEDQGQAWNYLLWVVGCLLTGLLAGLGAPFWHDLVTGIQESAQALRGSRRRTASARV